MDLRYILPRPDLRPFVRAYYYFAVQEQAVQPLCAELGNIRVVLDGAGSLTMPDGKQRQIKSAFLIGPTMGAYTMDAIAGTRVFGVGVRPRGWKMLMGIDAQEAADQVFDLSDLAGSIGAGAIDEIRNAPDLPAMANAADRFFDAIITRRMTNQCAYPEAFQNWLMNSNELNLDRLIECMDVSRRQTDRLAKEYFGASPKFLQRKYRALRAADRIRSGVFDWKIAAGDDYYDQSHFIREFKTFIGVTPGQFIGHRATLIEQVRDNRRLMSAELPLASL